jgi:hypothetical protein
MKQTRTREYYPIPKPLVNVCYSLRTASLAIAKSCDTRMSVRRQKKGKRKTILPETCRRLFSDQDERETFQVHVFFFVCPC